jgi:hypothetical protein
MTNLKSLLIGGVLGILSAVSGLGLARADEPSVYELAFELAEIRCDEASQGWIESGLTEAVVGGQGGMYEACMRLSVPPMVLTPAQHYDTTDGAFWRTGGAL